MNPTLYFPNPLRWRMDEYGFLPHYCICVPGHNTIWNKEGASWRIYRHVIPTHPSPVIKPITSVKNTSNIQTWQPLISINCISSAKQMNPITRKSVWKFVMQMFFGGNQNNSSFSGLSWSQTSQCQNQLTVSRFYSHSGMRVAWERTIVWLIPTIPIPE